MIVICTLIWLASLVFVALKHKHNPWRDEKGDRLARDEFAKRVKYIRFLETVPTEKCERCNHKKRLRGVLTLARLCRKCQDELGLTRQVYGGL